MAAEIGITDCTHDTLTQGRLTSVSVASTSITSQPMKPSSAKNPITSASTATVTASRGPGGIMATSSGQLMWLRRAAAYAEP